MRNRKDVDKVGQTAQAVAAVVPRQCGVLIVEDDPDLQWRLARMLTVQGNRVVGTSSGDGALALIAEWPVDLVLVDEDLPGMDGLEVARHIQRTHPDVPVILMAVQETQEVQVAARLAGVVACLTKPFRVEVLAELHGVSQGATRGGPGTRRVAPTAVKRALRIGLAILVLLAIVAGAHAYLWLRLVHDPELSPPVARAATLVLIALGLALPAAPLLSRRLPRQAATVLSFPVYLWMGVAFLLLVVLGAGDAVRLFLPIAPRTDAEVAIIVVALLAAVAVRSALGPVSVREVHVTLPRLPAPMHGTSLVQLSDLHIGPLLGRPFLERVVAQTNALEPDLIVITGDLVDGPVEQLAPHVAPLADLRARHGVYFVTGNHEYYAETNPVRGADRWIAHLEALGIRVLRNEHVPIERDGHGFDLAGVDDSHAASFGGGHGADVAAAVAGRDPCRALVLLAHQPLEVRHAARHGVGLQLSGHTHDGQIWPFGWLVRLQQPYVAGLARHGDTHVYVSRGTGFWGPPMRLFAPSEVTRIVLDAA